MLKDFSPALCFLGVFYGHVITEFLFQQKNQEEDIIILIILERKINLVQGEN